MLRILTYNVALQDVRIFNHSFYCPVNFIKQRLTLLPAALLKLDADVLCLQEAFHHDFQRKLYQSLSKTFPYITGLSRPGLKLRLGNELLTLSKFPLHQGKLIRFHASAMEEHLFTNKGFFHTVISHPEYGEIDLINFHTTSGGVHVHPETDRMEDLRSGQIEQMLGHIDNLDNVILAGDLNAGPHTSSANYKRVLDAGLVDACWQGNERQYSWDADNPLVINGNEAHLPSQCIDHVFLNEKFSREISHHETEIVLNDAILKIKGKYYPLSDHYGVLARLQ